MKKIVALLLVLVLVFGISACGTPAAEEQPVASADSTQTEETTGLAFEGREIVLGAWGGTFAEAALEAYVKPFEEMTGATITIEEYGDDVTAKVIAQQEQDIPGFDMICGVGALDQVAVMSQHDAVLELDYSMLPNAESIPDNAKFDYAIGQYIISTGLAWNTDVHGDNPPDTMEKFFDVENYPGNRALIGYSPSGIYEMALMSQGASFDGIYPLDVDQALEILETVKPSITKWWNSAAEIRQALADGEVDSGIFWGGSVIESIMVDGLDNIALSHEGAGLITDCFAIPSTCQDVELAYAFLDYCLSPEAGAKWTELKFYAPVNPAAYDLISDELAALLPTSEENIDGTFWCDVPYWQENFEENAERYLLMISE